MSDPDHQSSLRKEAYRDAHREAHRDSQRAESKEHKAKKMATKMSPGDFAKHWHKSFEGIKNNLEQGRRSRFAKKEIARRELDNMK